MRKEKKRITFKRVCDDLIIGSVIGYFITVIAVQVLNIMQIVDYSKFKTVLMVIGLIITVVCLIRYTVEYKKIKSKH